MTDPFTLAGVGALVLAGGVKFLYDQAGDALKRWRRRKDAHRVGGTEPVDARLPADAFEGRLDDPHVHFDAVQRLEPALVDLRHAVADYADGIYDIDPDDQRLLQAVDGLRQAMEAVYGQRITFQGEPRAASGPVAIGQVRVDDVLGYVAGLRARDIINGSATGRVEAGTVHPGGTAVGLDVGTLGSPPRRSSSPSGDPDEHGEDRTSGT